jgi:hypothetical protein
MNERPEILTPTEARQASPRRLNFRVLVISMLLAVVVAGILYYAVYEGGSNSEISLPPTTTQQPQ